MKIYFKDSDFISVTRSELFGVVDFLSNCGGLLGLFMGISLLSMVEFVYYFSLRWACALKEKPEPDDDNKDDNDKEKNIIIVEKFESADQPAVTENVTLHQQ